ncbi:hypothetical protein D3C84_1128160 [compost metagenome]
MDGVLSILSWASSSRDIRLRVALGTATSFCGVPGAAPSASCFSSLTESGRSSWTSNSPSIEKSSRNRTWRC